MAASLEQDSSVFSELWISLDSLLRSYMAAHGLNLSQRAFVTVEGQRITVRHGEKWLRFERTDAQVTWTRDNGSSGEFELTLHGRICRGFGEEEELDMAAEAWARELMQDQTTELAQ